MEFELHMMKMHKDARGALCVGDFGNDIPFVPARFFMVFDVPVGAVRGLHAHRICQQFLVCVNGKVDVLLDDGMRKYSHSLDSPEIGLHIPAGIWGEQTYLTSKTKLIVFASHEYDPADYINDYDSFLAYKR